MKNFMFNFNAKKKISITSALFSLLILFFTLNCGFCSNFCSASLSDDNDKSKPTIIDDFADDGIFNNSEASRSEEETTNETETETPKEGEEDENENNEEDKKNLPPANETDNQDEKKDENESTEAKKPKRKGICGFCEIC